MALDDWSTGPGEPTLEPMPRVPERPEPLRRRFFHARIVLEQGLLTKKRLRSRAWRRLFRGIYADSSRPLTHGLRCAAASRYLLPAGAALAGRSAATLLGSGLARPTDPVEILVPPSATFGPVEGLRIHSAELCAEDVCRIRGMPVTRPVRTCWDLARWLTVIEAVVLIDRMLGMRIVTRTELVRYAQRRASDRGGRRFAQAVRLADGGSGSPQESRLRVRFVLAGLPRPEVQFSVVVDGRLLARVDLAWPDLKIAVEYDGLWHVGSARQMHDDRERLNRLMGAGWVVIHVTSARLRDDFDGVVAEVSSVISARRTGSFRV
jgi:hypothetical protein